jgi:predicted unusual protein kinase regulating ubiquinone biosynthesis (AarF/ABC1/UbiB family)
MRPSLSAPGLDRRRQRRVRRFFIRAALHILWWDIILNRPLLQRFRTPTQVRWPKLAHSYRRLALELGGVLIKLGQFLGSRVDLFPPEVISVFDGLQDEVPPAPFEMIAAQTEADFGRPLATIFAAFSPQAIGAASLGQAHRARLACGTEVVVKVLRPGIATVVESDLQVIARFANQLKYIKTVRRHVDLEALTKEFVDVTRRELDLVAEGHNADRFASEFAKDPQVYVPKIYWDYTAPHTLTMEDVGYIRITDVEAMRGAGIDPYLVIKKLFDLYLEQFSIVHFVHADPHRGNLFVKPLPVPGESFFEGKGAESPVTTIRPGDAVAFAPGRPFQIAFVDFGMSVSIPERLRRFMRNYIIGIGTRDAHLIVEAYVDGGIMLPGADLERVEKMTQALLDRFSGSLFGQMKNIDFEDYTGLLIEFRDLLYSSPFQFQSDLLFVFRALGLLAGIASQVAPEFEAITTVGPFARRLIMEDWQPNLEGLGRLALMLYKFANRLDEVLTKAQRGQLIVKSSPDDRANRTIRQLRTAISRLTWMVAAAGLFIGGVAWKVGDSVIQAVTGKAMGGLPAGVLLTLAGAAFLVAIFKRPAG